MHRGPAPDQAPSPRGGRAALTALEPQSFEIEVGDEALDDLRQRLAATRWLEQPAVVGWDHGMDFAYLRALCGHWAGAYDSRRIERQLNGFDNWRWDGIHFIWERAPETSHPPIVLIHGWPGAVLEFRDLIPRLVAAGHDVIAPSLPGFGFSDTPSEPLNVAAVAARLHALVAEALGYDRYAVQGGDWGSIIGARMAFDHPESVAALHLNSPGVLPRPADLDGLAEEEIEFAQRAQRWRLRGGFHMLVQGSAPDALAPGLNDSPAGLAAWLVDKYRRWSDCGGEIERRFSRDDVCDFLTLYWVTETIGSSMRLYAAEGRDRWRLRPGERVEVPAAVADFPAEIVRPPRAWSERVLADLRRWSTFDRGGHFAAFEEPELLGDDVIAFLGDL